MMDKTDRSIYICSLNPGKSSVTGWQTQGNSFLLIPSVPAEQGHLLEAPHLEQGTECPIYLLHGRFSLAAQYTMKGLRSHEPSQTLRVLKFSRIPPSHYFLPHSSQIPALYATHHFPTHRPISHFCSPCSLSLKHLSPTLEITHSLRTAQISPAWRTPPP